jgi:hypothetical protein
MSENQARRVAVEFTILGADHATIVKRATELWQRYIGDPTVTLPFDTEFNVTTENVTGDDTGNVLAVEWAATVIIRQRGSNYS